MSNDNSAGQCLCGAVKWSFSGPGDTTSHCHCSMCRKAHGAAFATFTFVERENFQWQSETESIQTYQSSPGLTRSFCKHCGSAVPIEGLEDDAVEIPVGSHDRATPAQFHIFAASKAPWYEITDALKRYDEYPPQETLPAIETPELEPPEPGKVRGSCLCGEVAFVMTEPFKQVFNCHCSRCRRARSAVHTTNGFTTFEGVEILRGGDNMVTYKLPDARFFTQVFCKTCGAKLPRLDPERNIAVVPLGALDDDPDHNPDCHIFIGSKAPWYEITDDLPRFDQGPH